MSTPDDVLDRHGIDAMTAAEQGGMPRLHGRAHGPIA